jgi:hypothetical protein
LEAQYRPIVKSERNLSNLVIIHVANAARWFGAGGPASGAVRDDAEGRSQERVRPERVGGAVLRYYRLLVRIRIVYMRLYRQELRTRVKSVVSGEYCLLLSVFDAAEAEFGASANQSNTSQYVR